VELHGASGGAPKPIRRGRLKTDRLLRELSSEEDSDEIHVSHSSPSDSSKPWMREFNQYIQVRDEVPEGMTLVQWWGVCFECQLDHDVVILNSPLDE
jgi:hypothetical protein